MIETDPKNLTEWKLADGLFGIDLISPKLFLSQVIKSNVHTAIILIISTNINRLFPEENLPSDNSYMPLPPNIPQIHYFPWNS